MMTRNTGDPISDYQKIAGYSIDDVQYYMVGEDRDRNLYLDNIVVNKEICRKFEIYNIDLIIAVEKPIYPNFDIQNEYTNIFTDPWGLSPRYPHRGIGDFSIYLFQVSQ
jgi:hypothetical protein